MLYMNIRLISEYVTKIFSNVHCDLNGMICGVMIYRST